MQSFDYSRSSAYSRADDGSSVSSRPRAAQPPPRDHGLFQSSAFNASRRPLFPPPVSVEDEAESLAREHGAFSLASAEHVPPSRGERDQNPIIMEVHEYNPERRFVMMNEQSKAYTNDSQTRPTDTKLPEATNKESNGRPEASAAQKPKLPVNTKQSSVDGAEPGLDSRRSKQDLPPLNTERPPLRQHEDQTSRSTAAADANRPNYFSPRMSRPPGDQLLSPDVIQSAPGNRDKLSRGWSHYTVLDETSPTRQTTRFDVSDRDRGSLHHRRTRTNSISRPVDVSFEAAEKSKRVSGEWRGDPRRSRDPSPSSRSVEKEYSRSSRRRQRDAGVTPPQTPREQSRSSNTSKDARAYLDLQNPPLVFQDANQVSMGKTSNNRSRSRVRTMPVGAAAAAATSATFMPRNSATFPLDTGSQRHSRSTEASLPYPDDDDTYYGGVELRDGHGSSPRSARPSLAVKMPEPSLSAASSGQPSDRWKSTSPVATPKKVPEHWQVPPFDPDGKPLTTDRPIGSYRRYSETKEKNGSGGLPECPRILPLMGKTDWLTLPRTNFNICPSCYDSIFAKTNFRTHFQPILRPTDEAIACDFGSSPWYRIAWLLTVKHDRQDLRLLYNVVGVAGSLRDEECPGALRSNRRWLTINDPYTKRPVPEFMVCHRCAMTIEALLPNLAGLFMPLGSKAEALKGVCAMHFTPKREQFVRYFDVLETTSDKALMGNQAPDIADLAQELRRLSVGRECREDSPVLDGYWHMMPSLPELTVCSSCFDEVVRPKVLSGNTIAQGFFTKAQRLPSATCQLYSPRMREIFLKACRRRDRDYLEAKVRERRTIEADIYEKLLKLDRASRGDAWSEKQVEKLVEEWKLWE